MTALGCSEIRAVSKFSSAFLTDLGMRGFAISFLTLECVALSGCFLLLLWSMHHHDIEIEAMQSHFAQFPKYIRFRETTDFV
jgi:hypothetical protein